MRRPIIWVLVAAACSSGPATRIPQSVAVWPDGGNAGGIGGSAGSGGGAGGSAGGVTGPTGTLFDGGRVACDRNDALGQISYFIGSQCSAPLVTYTHFCTGGPCHMCDRGFNNCCHWCRDPDETVCETTKACPTDPYVTCRAGTLCAKVSASEACCYSSGCANCAGCCLQGSCNSGTTLSVCGRAGSECTRCLSTQGCSDGGCTGADTASPGDPCSFDADCRGGRGGCRPAHLADGGLSGWPGGYCNPTCLVGTCAAGAVCVADTRCFGGCSQANGGQRDCRAGYVCAAVPGGGGGDGGICVPSCTSRGAGCDAGTACQSDGYCR